MSFVNDKRVVASGVLHLVAGDVVRTDTTPHLSFRHGETRNGQAISGVAVQDGFTFTVDPKAGDTGVMRFTGTLDTSDFKVTCVTVLLAVLESGPLYEVRYTISEL